MLEENRPVAMKRKHIARVGRKQRLLEEDNVWVYLGEDRALSCGSCAPRGTMLVLWPVAQPAVYVIRRDAELHAFWMECSRENFLLWRRGHLGTISHHHSTLVDTHTQSHTQKLQRPSTQDATIHSLSRLTSHAMFTLFHSLTHAHSKVSVHRFSLKAASAPAHCVAYSPAPAASPAAAGPKSYSRAL